MLDTNNTWRQQRSLLLLLDYYSIFNILFEIHCSTKECYFSRFYIFESVIKFIILFYVQLIKLKA